jgi:putative ABC transport system permease protein
MANLFRRFWYIATGRRQEFELVEELEFHRQMKAQELRDRGVSEAEVAAATQRLLGNDLAARQRARDVWVWPWLQDITQDVRFGLRMLAKDRRFTLAAVLALGLGIGVNNAVFTIVNTMLFRELPFPESSRLVVPQFVDPRGIGPVSYADFLDWSSSAKSFEGLSAHSGGTMSLSSEGQSAERMRGTYISSNAFRLLRAKPILGREFIAEDDRPGAPAVTILGYDVWQSRYGGDSSIIGRGVRVNGLPYTIIGVMPPGFAFPMTTQMWQPLTSMPNLSAAKRGARNLNVFGRLAPGVELIAARAELETIAAQIARDHSDTNKDLRLRLTTMKDSGGGAGQANGTLGALIGAVAFVLLIACANVASLLLARSSHRSREMAIRASLGATRWRIVRQLLIECGLIAILASALGLWLSIYGAREMATAFNVYDMGAPGGTVKPYWVDVSINGATWMFLGGACLFASLAIGIVPSWHLSKTNVNDVLKDGGRTGSATVRARRMTGGLLIVEMALTVILLTGAGLLTRAFFNLYLTDLGMDTRGVVTMRIVLPLQKYPTREQQRQFADHLDERLATLPVFSAAALGSDIPLYPLDFFASRSLSIEGQPVTPGQQLPEASYVTVGPRYFETLGLTLLRGRALGEADGLPGREGAIVNQRFAARFFPDGEALGRRIQLTSPTIAAADAPWITIVGVSPSLPNFFGERRVESVVYVPMHAERGPQRAVSIIVRAAEGDAGKQAAVAALREQVSALDPDLPVFGIQTLDEAVAMARNSNRIIGSWFITIALIALVLATVGIYALTAHSVAQRANEIGIRMALGAQALQVVWLFIRRTLIQLTIGLALGLAGALAIGKLLASFLRDTDPRDPITLASVAAILVVVALTASGWPARRAARVDPVEALRAD